MDLNQENKLPENRKNSMSNPSFNSTPKSVLIEKSDSSPSNNSSNLLDQTCYFSPITSSNYCSHNSLNYTPEKMSDITNIQTNAKHEHKDDSKPLFSSPIKSSGRKVREPQSVDYKRTKRAQSLVNPGSIRQFQLLNRRGSKIYGSSQEFLDHLDKEQPFYEGMHATSRHHSLVPTECKPIDLSPVLKNKSLKILDQAQKNTDDDIFTVLGE